MYDTHDKLDWVLPMEQMLSFSEFSFETRAFNPISDRTLNLIFKNVTCHHVIKLVALKRIHYFSFLERGAMSDKESL